MGLWGNAVAPFLPDRDYLPVAMPTTDVGVLQVLTRTRGALRRYSDLDRVVIGATAGPPVVLRDQPVVDASGSATRQVKVGIGLNVVSALIRALGGEAGLNLTVEKATTIEYGYSDVVADRVDLATLDAWLADSDLAPNLRNAADLIAAESMYVVVAALKARAVEVRLLDDRANAVEVDVPAVQAAVGGTLTVSGGSSRTSRMTFRGVTAVTVAAKAAQLRLDERGIWVNERLRSDGEIRGLGAAPPDYTFLTCADLRLD
jgi:hypothetical protein